MSPRLILVGGGKMGGALLEGWIARRTSPSDILVVEPGAETAAALRKRLGVTVVDDLDRAPARLSPEVVVFAVKPQVMDAVVPAYGRFAEKKPLFLSIAAGTTVGFFEKRLGKVAVIRCMPNLPASVHRGMTGAFANPRVTEAQRRRADDLLGAVGDVAWVEDEALIDAVTAVSGSGPAYVFLLAECLAEAGTAAGLSPELAARLARATVAGAGELLARSSESAAALRRNVTSPGGTTAAAMEILMGKGGFPELLTRGVAAAAERSRQLAQS